ncbi:hypothetical protein [Terriglobus roseus]|uniref:Uncharacterized protein n=1 Tax=Terriglobus roseus TaxID=392734 RepID=A0A1H4NCK4_9BACT|nr:hypothetical protein [Terriglobus roseus]SEB92605.1 hypothetical protein SAMN05443244_2200 [Terriglobus roseus]
MSYSPRITEIELLDDRVLVIFEPEIAAVLTKEDLHELAVHKNAFVQPEDLD